MIKYFFEIIITYYPRMLSFKFFLIHIFPMHLYNIKKKLKLKIPNLSRWLLIRMYIELGYSLQLQIWIILSFGRSLILNELKKLSHFAFTFIWNNILKREIRFLLEKEQVKLYLKPPTELHTCPLYLPQRHVHQNWVPPSR